MKRISEFSAGPGQTMLRHWNGLDNILVRKFSQISYLNLLKVRLDYEDHSNPIGINLRETENILLSVIHYKMIKSVPAKILRLLE